MNIVLLGAPGAGKGTQAEKLVAEFNFKHVSTGDLLRAAVREGSDLGKKAKTYMDAGDLVPDEIVIGLVEELLKKDPSSSYLLDGFPRTTTQAVSLDTALDKLGTKLDYAVNLVVDNDAVVARLSKRRCCKMCGYIGSADDGSTCPKCGGEMFQRDDDQEEAIKNRLVTFDTQTKPLIDYYKGNGRLLDIDGSKMPDEVFAQVKAALS
ncbi:MAG: adenylate kinase [Coriobacteriales bacterium]|nr:adenylate kinase [Coriobacteriales bacterium]